jgi:hypothetical protein
MEGTKTVVKATGTETTTGDMIEHRRLQIDARKWILSKALPKVYSERLAVDSKHLVVDENNKEIDYLETARHIALIFASARAEIDEQAKLGGEEAGQGAKKH